MPDLTKMSVEELCWKFGDYRQASLTSCIGRTPQEAANRANELGAKCAEIIAELTRRMEVPKGHVVVDADTVRQAMEVIDDSLEERAPRHELGGLFCRLRNALAASEKGMRR